MGEIATKGRILREAVAPYASSDPAAPFVKLSVSLPQDVVDVVRAAAAETGLSVSATIAAALRRTLVDAEQARLDAALALDAEENVAWATAIAPMAAELMAELEW